MKDLFQKFLNYEYENKLNEKYPQWTFIRPVIVLSFMRSDDLVIKKKQQRKNKKVFSLYKNIITNCVKYVIYFIVSIFLKFKKEIYLIIPFYRNEKNIYPCKYTYKYYNLFIEKVIVFKKYNEYRHKEIISSKNMAVLYLYLVKNKIIKDVCKIIRNKETNNNLIKFVEQFYINNNIKYNNDILEYLSKDLTNIDKLLMEYKNIDILLKKINVKIIFEVSVTRAINQVINYYTKMSEIKTIELQHGPIGPEHYSYHFSEENIRSFPKMFFCFGEYWKNNNVLPLNKAMISSTGLPYFNDKKIAYKNKKLIRKLFFLCLKI